MRSSHYIAYKLYKYSYCTFDCIYNHSIILCTTLYSLLLNRTRTLLSEQYIFYQICVVLYIHEYAAYWYV